MERFAFKYGSRYRSSVCMIHCFGNSHVNTFSNCDYLSFESKNDIFKLYHLGPTIAYNFKDNHLYKVYQQLQDICVGDYISLILGEVDCRLHLPMRIVSVDNIEEIVVECVERLFESYKKLISDGYKCIHFSTHPTCIIPDKENEQYVVGDVYFRNNICVVWNSVCEKLCNKNGIPFINFYDLLVDKNNLTKMEYFIDYCHLNSKMVFKDIVERIGNVL